MASHEDPKAIATGNEEGMGSPHAPLAAGSHRASLAECGDPLRVRSTPVDAMTSGGDGAGDAALEASRRPSDVRVPLGSFATESTTNTEQVGGMGMPWEEPDSPELLRRRRDEGELLASPETNRRRQRFATDRRSSLVTRIPDPEPDAHHPSDTDSDPDNPGSALSGIGTRAQQQQRFPHHAASPTASAAFVTSMMTEADTNSEEDEEEQPMQGKQRSISSPLQRQFSSDAEVADPFPVDAPSSEALMFTYTDDDTSEDMTSHRSAPARSHSAVSRSFTPDSDTLPKLVSHGASGGVLQRRRDAGEEFSSPLPIRVRPKSRMHVRRMTSSVSPRSDPSSRESPLKAASASTNASTKTPSPVAHVPPSMRENVLPLSDGQLVFLHARDEEQIAMQQRAESPSRTNVPPTRRHSDPTIPPSFAIDSRAPSLVMDDDDMKKYMRGLVLAAPPRTTFRGRSRISRNESHANAANASLRSSGLVGEGPELLGEVAEDETYDSSDDDMNTGCCGRRRGQSCCCDCFSRWMRWTPYFLGFPFYVAVVVLALFVAPTMIWALKWPNVISSGARLWRWFLWGSIAWLTLLIIITIVRLCMIRVRRSKPIVQYVLDSRAAERWSIAALWGCLHLGTWVIIVGLPTPRAQNIIFRWLGAFTFISWTRWLFLVGSRMYLLRMEKVLFTEVLRDHFRVESLLRRLFTSQPFNSEAGHSKHLSNFSFHRMHQRVINKRTYRWIGRFLPPDHQRLDGRAARILARYLVHKYGRGKGFITVTDIAYRYEKSTRADEAFALLDFHSNRRASEQSLRRAFKDVFKSRANLWVTFADRESLSGILGRVMSLVYWVLAVLISLLVLGVPLGDWWITFSALLLSFAFVFTPFLQGMWASLILLFVIKPFDVGDRIVSGSHGTLIVTRIHFLSTVFQSPDGRQFVILNKNLYDRDLIQYKRSEKYVVNFSIKLLLSTTGDQLANLDRMLKDWLRRSKHPWNIKGYGAWVDQVEDFHNLLVSFWLPLDGVNWQQVGLWLSAKTDALIAVHGICRALDLTYVPLEKPLAVKMRNVTDAEPSSSSQRSPRSRSVTPATGEDDAQGIPMPEPTNLVPDAPPMRTRQRRQ